MNCLVVEDCDVNILVIKSFLKKFDKNLVIEFAENGEVAVEKFLKTDFDVILMDINMPVMDGITATRIIKKVNPDVNVVAVTAVELDYLKSKNSLSLFNHIMFKPLRYEHFLSTMKNMFKDEEEVSV